MGSIPGSGRSIGEEHGNPLQYSCLEHPIDRGAWWARVHRVANSWTRLKQLSTHKCMQSVLSYTPSRASAVIKGRTGDFLKAESSNPWFSWGPCVSDSFTISKWHWENTLWVLSGRENSWGCGPVMRLVIFAFGTLVPLLLPFLHEQFPSVSPVWSVH